MVRVTPEWAPQQTVELGCSRGLSFSLYSVEQGQTSRNISSISMSKCVRKMLARREQELPLLSQCPHGTVCPVWLLLATAGASRDVCPSSFPSHCWPHRATSAALLGTWWDIALLALPLSVPTRLQGWYFAVGLVGVCSPVSAQSCTG